MTHLWKQTIDINELTAARVIESQHNLSVKTVTLLDEGWDNFVYLVNNKFIFRFPRRIQAVNCIENEIALLPFIAKHVSFELSTPKWIGIKSQIYPYPYVGYEMIPGLPICDATSALIHDDNFAKILANWLKELHAIKIISNSNSIRGDQSWRLNINDRISRCKENLNQYQNYFFQAGFDTKLLAEIITLLSNLKFSIKMRSYLHGDLYSRHIIVNPKTLLPSGLIDWGDIHIGHPGIDLAVAMIFTETALKTFLDIYENVDSETIPIMLFHSFCHSLSFLPYSYEQNREALKTWACLVLARAVHEIQKYLFNSL